MKNRLRSEFSQGSATASRRATRVLDCSFASAFVATMKGADAPFFLQKSVTYVREHPLPMSQVHRQLRRGAIAASASLTNAFVPEVD